MKTLVAWDDPGEAELLDLYLNTDGIHAPPSRIVPSVIQPANGGWDSSAGWQEADGL